MKRLYHVFNSNVSFYFCFEGIYEKINSTTSSDWNEGHPFRDRRNIALFITYAKERRCGFRVERMTFNTSLAWISFFFGLTALLYHLF